jgi:hypothetical protein
MFRGSFAGGLLLALVTAMIPITAFAGNAPGPVQLRDPKADQSAWKSRSGTLQP